MVNLRLTKMQVQEILLWAGYYKYMLKEVGMGMDKDEIDLHLKIFKTSRPTETIEEIEKEFYSRYPDKEGWYEGMVRKLNKPTFSSTTPEPEKHNKVD